MEEKEGHLYIDSAGQNHLMFDRKRREMKDNVLDFLRIHIVVSKWYPHQRRKWCKGTMIHLNVDILHLGCMCPSKVR